MVTFLILGAGIGVVAGLSPGPVLTLVVAETLKAGWPRGAAVSFGPLLADGPIIALAFSVVAQLPPQVEQVLSVGGGLFLLCLAITTALQSKNSRLPRGEPRALRGGFARGFLARALSPNPYLFWFLVGVPTLLQALRDSWWSAAAFLVGYYGMIVGSNVGLAVFISTTLGHVSDRTYRRLLRLTSLILAVYGLLLLQRSAQDR